ncbi:MAG: tyrosine-type recombinase/integrase [Bdellovibrionota bacterium]
MMENKPQKRKPQKTRQNIKPNVYRIVMIDPETQNKSEPDLPYEAARRITRGGKREREWSCFRTLAEACKFAASTEVKAADVTFDEVLRSFEECELAHLESSSKAKNIGIAMHLEFFKGKIVSTITPLMIDKWIALLRSKEYLDTQHATRLSYIQEMKLLKRVLGYYRSRFDIMYPIPILPEHRKRLVVRKKALMPKKDLSLAEFEGFVKALEDITRGGPYECMPVMARAQYGIYGRIQEAAALFCEDIDPRSGAIKVQRKVMWARRSGMESVFRDGLKKNEGKVIRSKFTCQFLTEWMVKKGIRQGPLFGENGQPVPYRMIQYYYDQAFIRMNLPHRGTHIIRHAALSEHYETCRDIQQTKMVAGHSDLSTTQVYAKVRDTALQDTQNLMDDKLRSLNRG